MDELNSRLAHILSGTSKLDEDIVHIANSPRTRSSMHMEKIERAARWSPRSDVSAEHYAKLTKLVKKLIRRASRSSDGTAMVKLGNRHQSLVTCGFIGEIADALNAAAVQYGGHQHPYTLYGVYRQYAEMYLCPGMELSIHEKNILVPYLSDAWESTYRVSLWLRINPAQR